MAALADRDRANPHWVPRSSVQKLHHIPGEDGPPLVGTTLRVLRDPIGYGAYMARTYGPVFRTNSFGIPTISLVGVEANELVLLNRDKLFSSEQGWGPVLNLLFPRGLMLMDFEAHRIDRRALSVAFKPEPMHRYATELSQGMAAGIAAWPTGEQRIYPAIKQLTLDLAASAFLGVPLGREATLVNQAFVDTVQASVGVVRRPLPFTAMGRGVAGRNYLIAYFGPQIEERRRNLNRQDMFSQFCRATREDGALLSDSEIIDHMNFLMMAAHDTITSSLTSMVWMLARHPEWQERLRGECLSVAPTGGAIDPDALGKLELTDRAFKETLRMIPPVPTLPRRALRDFNFMGHDIPAGTVINLSPTAVHRMAQHRPEPERFDPMRFAPDQVRDRHKYAWVPFGGGAHMCLGLHFATMQTRLFIRRLLTTRRVTIAPGYAPKWQAWPIPKPKDGLKVTLNPL